MTLLIEIGVRLETVVIVGGLAYLIVQWWGFRGGRR